MRRRDSLQPIIFWLLIFSLFSISQAQPILKATAKDYPEYSRVVITCSSPLTVTLEKNQNVLQIKITSKSSFRFQSEPVQSRLISSFTWSRRKNEHVLAIEAKHSNFRHEYSTLQNGRQLVIDFYQTQEKAKEAEAAPQAETIPSQQKKEENLPAPVAPPTPQKQSLSASKGVKTIVIDPGHGGLESGAKGKFGNLEKDVTLAIGLKLRAVIEKNLAFRVVMTRDRDMDVGLENRAALANNNKADLFISIHANSSLRKNAQGSETFFLSLNATDEEARRLAYLENSSAELEAQIDQENPDQIKMILWDMAQAAFIKQSSQLAEIIQTELNTLLGTENRGIKQAPFKVLTGVACPAVLVEVAFISNSTEEKKLLEEEFQDNVVQAIYRGLVSYLKLLS